MRKLLVVLYQPYKWLVYVPFLILSTLTFGAIAVILSTLVNQRVGSFIGGAVWSRLNGYMTPIFVKVIGKENIEPTQSYVIVPNHQSHFDVFVLYGWLGIDFKWVLKQELRKYPAWDRLRKGRTYFYRPFKSRKGHSLDKRREKKDSQRHLRYLLS